MELELLKEIPGYKAIIKSVLKAQIQLLIEQLSEQAGEETVLLTASLNDGTLSHQASSMGKGFFVGRDDMKSQFLGYCLKNHHDREFSLARATQQDHLSNAFETGQPSSKRQRFQPQPIVGTDGSQGFEEQDTDIISQTVPDPVPKRKKVLPKKPLKRKPAIKPAINPKPSIPSPVSEHNKPVGDTNNPMTIVKVENTSDAEDFGDFNNGTIPSNVPSSVQFGHSEPSDGGQKDSYTESDDPGLQSDMKVELGIGQEQELEIPDMELTGQATGPPVDWGDTSLGELGYQSAISGDDSINQSGNQFRPEHLVSLGEKNDEGQFGEYCCHICGKSLGSKRNLNRHYKIHSGRRDFVCPICDKAFQRKDYLRVHILGHSGQKDHVCQYCDKAFFQKSNLNQHIVTVHLYK